jgi:predicted DNA-binding transcriptional regulator AlpA
VCRNSSSEQSARGVRHEVRQFCSFASSGWGRTETWLSESTTPRIHGASKARPSRGETLATVCWGGSAHAGRNEKPSPWGEILSAHDVARLTRRHRWVVHALALIGRFPKPQRFHDRSIGWAKHDVASWLAEVEASRGRLARTRRQRTHSPALLQQSLPMHFPRTRRARGPCVSRRKGDRS